MFSPNSCLQADNRITRPIISGQVACAAMKELYLIEAHHALPFIGVLKARGAKIKSLARQAGLPLEAALHGKGIIGERSLWRFIEYAAQQQNDPLFGYHCAAASSVVENGRLGAMPLNLKPSLEELLRQFFIDARNESNGCNYDLISDDDGSWLHRRPIFQGGQRSWQVEQYMLQIFIQVVRICAGPDWVPDEVLINSRKTPQAVPEEWQGIQFTWGQKSSAIKISSAILALPPRLGPLIESGQNGDRSTDLSKLSIEGLVERQLATGKATLDDAANELGISSATLKRRLRRIGSSYSELLESCRLKKARYLLINTRIPITQLSRDLGYGYAQNFTRSFKRITGMSPTSFREYHK